MMMPQITIKDLETLDAYAKKEQFSVLAEDQNDKKVVAWVLLGLAINAEKALGFLLAYTVIKNCLAKEETAALEDLYKKE